MQQQSRISFLRFYLPLVVVAITVVLSGCYQTYIKLDKYKKGGFHKAIATDFMGNSGQSWNHPTVEAAMRRAIEECEKTWKTPCKIIEVDEMPYEENTSMETNLTSAGSTTIKIVATSDPPGADLYAGESPEDLQYVGRSPKTETYTNINPYWTARYYQFKRYGYEPSEVIFKPNGEPNADRYVHATLKPIIENMEHQAEDNLSQYNDIDKQPKKDPTTEYHQGVRWAVVIGISKYRDSQIPSLRYASKDANSFYKWLISAKGGGYAPSNVKLLIGKDAIGRNIKDALFDWLAQALEEDMVTIYFAGHGTPQSPDELDNLFLLPYDAQYGKIAATGFPMWDIETALNRFIKAKKVVVIADACHAGGVGQSYDVARRANRGIEVNPISSGFQNLSQIGDGVAVISASDDKQFSQESQKWGGGHGVFTYFLIEGLKGKADYIKDGNITLGELIPYLSEQVRRATKNAQSPTVAGRYDPALSIGR